MTPHSSGVTRDTFAGRAEDIAANIGRLHRGESLHNVVGRRRSSEPASFGASVPTHER